MFDWIYKIDGKKPPLQNVLHADRDPVNKIVSVFFWFFAMILVFCNKMVSPRFQNYTMIWMFSHNRYVADFCCWEKDILMCVDANLET